MQAEYSKFRPRTMPQVDGQDQHWSGSVDQTSENKNIAPSKKARKTLGKLGRYHNGRYQGIFYALLCSIIMVILCSLYKDLSQYSSVVIAFYYSIVSTSFGLPSLVWNIRFLPELSKRLLFLWTVLILVIGFCGIFRVNAFQMLPIGEASSICFSTPIVTAIFARIILKDRLTWMTLLSLLLSIVGMLLTMRLPELITSREERLGSIDHLIGCCYALGNVFCTSMFFIILRCLRDTSSLLNTFVQQFGASIFFACVSAIFGESIFPPCDVTIIVKLMSVGTLGLVFTIILNLAMQKDDPTTVGTVFRSCEIMLGFLVQVIIFKDSVDAYSISGAVVIFACGLMMPLQKWMQGQKEGSHWRESWLIK